MAETKRKKGTSSQAKQAGAKPRKKGPAITKQDALQIAQAYLADKGAFSVSGIGEGMPEEFHVFFAANVQLAEALKDCWIVECGLDPFLVVDGSTMLVGVSKTTGDIVYAGILSVA